MFGSSELIFGDKNEGSFSFTLNQSKKTLFKVVVWKNVECLCFLNLFFNWGELSLGSFSLPKRLLKVGYVAL